MTPTRSMTCSFSAKKHSFSNTRFSSFISFGPIGLVGLLGDLMAIEMAETTIHNKDKKKYYKTLIDYPNKNELIDKLVKCKDA